MKAAELRRSILQAAVEGKLVPQDPREEHASKLLERIRGEKERLVQEGKIKKTKQLPPVTEDEIPYELPEGWCWCRLDHLSQRIHYGFTTSASTYGNIRLLRITDIQNDKVKWECVPYCTVTMKIAEEYGLHKRDILIARTGGTVGKTYIVVEEGVASIFASYLIRVILSQVVNEQYIKYYLQSPFYWRQIGIQAIGTGQPNVNGTSLKHLLVSLPPLAEQQRIVDKLDVLMLQCDELERAEKDLDALDERFVERLPKSILQAAVEGQLVLQDPREEPASKLLERIRGEKERLVQEGKIKKLKPLPPITEDEIPYELPEGWRWCRVGSIHDLFRGITFPGTVKSASPFQSGIRCATTGSVQKEYNPYADVFVPEQYVKREYQWLSDYDILVSAANSKELVGKSCFWLGNTKMTFGGFLTVIRPQVSNINIKYSYYVFQFFYRSGIFSSHAKQTTNIANLSNQAISNILFPLPPLAEQQRIVDKVDILMGLCDTLKTVDTDPVENHMDAKRLPFIPHEEEGMRLAARGDVMNLSKEAIQAMNDLFAEDEE